MGMEKVVVHILGKDYQVACPLNERNALLLAASELDRRMRDIQQSGSVIGVERIAVMAALNLSNELLQSTGLKQDSQQRLDELYKRIDQVLSQ